MTRSAITRAVLASAMLAALAACNTVEGAGQDVGSAGHAVTNGASAVKNSM